MWDLPGPGLEPVSPALAGGFLTTASLGKPFDEHFEEPAPFTFLLPCSLNHEPETVHDCILIIKGA